MTWCSNGEEKGVWGVVDQSTPSLYIHTRFQQVPHRCTDNACESPELEQLTLNPPDDGGSVFQWVLVIMMWLCDFRAWPGKPVEVFSPVN